MGTLITYADRFSPNGYAIPYRMGERNYCPGCTRQHWHIGRLTAECAFCGTAIPMEAVHGYGAVQSFSSKSAGQQTGIAA